MADDDYTAAVQAADLQWARAAGAVAWQTLSDERARRIAGAVAAAERERVRFALLGCVRCRTVHDRRLNYDHPWQPRYLSPGYGDTNNYVGRVIDGAGYE